MNTATPTLETPPETRTAYSRVFWLSYLANIALVTANALQFRFAEFVKYLGGSEQLTGTIVSTGLIVAFIVRLKLGQEIDRFGTIKMWVASSCLFIASCGLFLLTSDLGWTIYAARIAFAVGLAGMFTSSIVFVQDEVPPERRTEMIGILGTSGFLGIITGSLVGDLILNVISDGALQFRILFGSAFVLGCCYLGIVLYLGRSCKPHEHQETPPLHQLLVHHRPGSVLLVAIMMGVGLVVTTVYLTRFATERGIAGIGLFFLFYSGFAFLFRVKTRHWSRTVGRHRMILVGLGGHCVGHLLLPFVHSEWEFIPSAIACGLGHALLFPAVVSLGADAFPRQYRGTGTTLVLGFTEIGLVLFAPPFGWIIDHYGFVAMFRTSAATAFVVGIWYAFVTAGHRDTEIEHAGVHVNDREGPVVAITHATGTSAAFCTDEEEELVSLEEGGSSIICAGNTCHEP